MDSSDQSMDAYNETEKLLISQVKLQLTENEQSYTKALTKINWEKIKIDGEFTCWSWRLALKLLFQVCQAHKSKMLSWNSFNQWQNWDPWDNWSVIWKRNPDTFRISQKGQWMLCLCTCMKIVSDCSRKTGKFQRFVSRFSGFAWFLILIFTYRRKSQNWQRKSSENYPKMSVLSGRVLLEDCTRNTLRIWRSSSKFSGTPKINKTNP